MEIGELLKVIKSGGELQEVCIDRNGVVLACGYPHEVVFDEITAKSNKQSTLASDDKVISVKITDFVDYEIEVE